MWTTEYNDDNYCIRDGVYGVVTGSCSTGVSIELENGTVGIRKVWSQNRPAGAVYGTQKG